MPLRINRIEPAHVPSRSGVWSLIKLSVLSWRQDYAASMGGALAYYTLFSIAPLLLTMISVEELLGQFVKIVF